MPFDELVHIEVGGKIDFEPRVYKPVSVEPFEEVVSVAQPSNSDSALVGMRAGEEIPTSDIRVLWRGGIFDPTGYAEETRTFLLPLSRRIRNLRAEGVVWIPNSAPLPESTHRTLDRLLSANLPAPYIEVINLPPSFFLRGEPRAAYRIGRTMYEAVGVHKYWADQCNLLDEIWVPSVFCEEIFRRSGVRKPIRVVPEPVDRTVFHPGEGRSSAAFRFLSVFVFVDRKGWDILLEAYCREFTRDEPVELVFRTYHPGKSLAEIVSMIADKIIEFDLPNDQLPIIKVLEDRILSQRQMADLYRSGDVLVAPSYGEGYGRPQIEALSCGVPVITTGWSGQTDFVTEENGWLIDYDLILEDTASDATFQPVQGGVWAKPRVDHLRFLMREAYSRHGERRKRASKAPGSVEFSDAERLADQVVERLTEVAHRPCYSAAYAPKPVLMVTSPRSHCEVRLYSENLLLHGLSEETSLFGFPYEGFDDRTSSPLVHLQYHPKYCNSQKIIRGSTEGMRMATIHDAGGFERISEMFDVITVFSERDRRLVSGFPLKSDARVVVLPYGFPAPVARPVKRRRNPVIGFYGFWGENSGLKELIFGFRKFTDTGYPKARLRIFALFDAYDADGSWSWSNECQRLAGSLGLAGQVDFEDAFLPEDEILERLSSETDMILMPYTKKCVSGVSYAIRLAMASMSPIVAGDASGFDEVGDAVIRLRTVTSESCAEAMRCVWENRGLQNYMLERALKRIQEEPYDLIIRQLLELYRELGVSGISGKAMKHGNDDLLKTSLGMARGGRVELLRASSGVKAHNDV